MSYIGTKDWYTEVAKGNVAGSNCDIWFTGIATANGTEASVDFEILLIDN